MPFISVNDETGAGSGSDAGLNLRPEVGISAPSGISAANSKFGPLAASNHPLPAFFHLFFKAMALFVYEFSSFISSSYIFIFVICIVLLAFDFWTVKNVSGRLLVGLRWWNKVNEDGSSKWVFNSSPNKQNFSEFDSTIFWGGLYGSTAVWALFFVFAFFLSKSCLVDRRLCRPGPERGKYLRLHAMPKRHAKKGPKFHAARRTRGFGIRHHGICHSAV